MLEPNEIKHLTKSLGLLTSEIKPSLQKAGAYKEYDIQESFNDLVNGLKMILCDNGIDPFQH